MGLIKAAKSAIGGTLKDTWLDQIKCENMGNDVLMVRKTTENGVISKGSRIIVDPGQVALIVDSGTVLDGAAEPGDYSFDASTAPSFFGGDFGNVFKEMWERFKYEGTPSRGQAVYYFNTKEIMDNKFGTPAPIPYKDWGHPNFNPRNNSYYPMAVNIKAFGSFTFKIYDPFLFMNRVGGTAGHYTKDNLITQIRSEFIAAFKNTLAELGSNEHKVEAMDLPHKDDEIVSIMREKKYDDHIAARGIAILSIAVENINFDTESDKKIRDYELSDAYTQSGHLAGATARAMEAAASNKSGAMQGFMGMGMAQSAPALGSGSLAEMMRNQSAAAMSAGWACSCGDNANHGNFCASCGKAKPSGTGHWKCECGHDKNTGKFCAGCGKPRPANKPEDGTWLCSCGSENKGAFCADCGTLKPKDAAQYRCDKCGWEPADKTKPPKFCQECGDVFDENDIVKGSGS